MTEQITGLIPLLKIISEKLETRANKLLKEYGITFSQIRVIILMYHSEKEYYSMKELEKEFCVSQQTMYGIIKRLEKKGLITDFISEPTSKTKNVCLTKEGERLGAKTYTMAQEIEGWVNGALTSGELDMAVELLNKIYNSLDQNDTFL